MPASAAPAVFPARAGGRDLFVARLTADLGSVLQATYFGGSGHDLAGSLVVTGDAVFICGSTISSDLPGTAGGAQPAPSGVEDAFVARFDRTLTLLTGATYLGGSDFDGAYGLTVAGDELLLVGSTLSTDFPGSAAGAKPAFRRHRGRLRRAPAAVARGPRALHLPGWAGNDTVAGIAAPAVPCSVAATPPSADLPATAGGASGARRSRTLTGRRPRLPSGRDGPRSRGGQLRELPGGAELDYAIDLRGREGDV